MTEDIESRVKALEDQTSYCDDGYSTPLIFELITIVGFLWLDKALDSCNMISIQISLFLIVFMSLLMGILLVINRRGGRK
jgi:hypothetical protein